MSYDDYLPGDDVPEGHEWFGKVRVESRVGSTKGKKWTLWLVTGADGSEFSTFDKSIADEAIALSGKPVRICWEDDGDYQRIFSIEPAE